MRIVLTRVSLNSSPKPAIWPLYTVKLPASSHVNCLASGPKLRALFEVGSVVCGAAPNSPAFIVGRAIAGLGSAGVFSRTIIIIIYLVPLHTRPTFTGFVGACFGIASVTRALLGGAFTNNVSWRWCFYINLPIGAITIAIIFVVLKLPSLKNANLSIRQQFVQLDPLGTLFFLPSTVCLLLALQWGGSTYAWKDGRIIAQTLIRELLEFRQAKTLAST